VLVKDVSFIFADNVHVCDLNKVIMSTVSSNSFSPVAKWKA